MQLVNTDPKEWVPRRLSLPPEARPRAHGAGIGADHVDNPLQEREARREDASHEARRLEYSDTAPCADGERWKSPSRVHPWWHARARPLEQRSGHAPAAIAAPPPPPPQLLEVMMKECSLTFFDSLAARNVPQHLSTLAIRYGVRLESPGPCLILRLAGAVRAVGRSADKPGVGWDASRRPPFLSLSPSDERGRQGEGRGALAGVRYDRPAG